MYQTVYTAKVDKYTVGGDIFHHTFKYLSLLEFRDDLFLLLFQLFFNQCLV